MKYNYKIITCLLLVHACNMYAAPAVEGDTYHNDFNVGTMPKPRGPELKGMMKYEHEQTLAPEASQLGKIAQLSALLTIPNKDDAPLFETPTETTSANKITLDIQPEQTNQMPENIIQGKVASINGEPVASKLAEVISVNDQPIISDTTGISVHDTPSMLQSMRNTINSGIKQINTTAKDFFSKTNKGTKSTEQVKTPTKTTPANNKTIVKNKDGSISETVVSTDNYATTTTTYSIFSKIKFSTSVTTPEGRTSTTTIFKNGSKLFEEKRPDGSTLKEEYTGNWPIMGSMLQTKTYQLQKVTKTIPDPNNRGKNITIITKFNKEQPISTEITTGEGKKRSKMTTFEDYNL